MCLLRTQTRIENKIDTQKVCCIHLETKKKLQVAREFLASRSKPKSQAHRACSC